VAAVEVVAGVEVTAAQRLAEIKAATLAHMD
jgi:hypothetical protein